jgi:hypothetical protein
MNEPVVREIVPSLTFNDGVAVGKPLVLDIDVVQLAKIYGIGTLVGASLTADGKIQLQGVR